MSDKLSDRVEETLKVFLNGVEQQVAKITDTKVNLDPETGVANVQLGYMPVKPADVIEVMFTLKERLFWCPNCREIGPMSTTKEEWQGHPEDECERVRVCNRSLEPAGSCLHPVTELKSDSLPEILATLGDDE